MLASRLHSGTAGIPCGYDSAGNFTGTPDRDCSDMVWGNTQTWPQRQPPPAHRFNNPIPFGMGARAIGMGEAFAAFSDDLSGVWYNPAGLTHMKKNEIHWMGGDRYTDIPYLGYLGASYMLENRMVFALSWMRPWHPTGFYPDVIAGTYGDDTGAFPNSGFTKWTGPGNPVLTIPGNPGQKVLFSDINDTAVQDFLRKAYRFYINPPFQENILAFTYGTPLSADRNLSFGINVKYLYNDSLYQADKQVFAETSGWGVDLGFQYRHPMRRFGKQLSVGLNLRDIAGQIRYNSGRSAGREVTLAPVTDLGIGWSVTDYFFNSDLNLAADLLYINDPALDDNANRRLYLGGEMWFLDGKIAPRAGYKMFFNRQLSGPTMGISFKYLVGLDYAYVFPAENEDATHWFTLSYRWGGPRVAIPTPDVNATVDPPIFSPKSQEYATFTLSAESENGIDRWNLNIIDRNNMVVKSYQDRGEPPKQIIWGGEDKTYRLLPDGEYTFLFTATDNLGGQSSTPVQTLKLYTPPKEVPVEENIDKLRELIKKQQAAEESVDDQVQAGAQAELMGVTATQKANTTLPPVAEEPVAPEAVTPLAQARAEAGSFAYPRVNDVPFASSQVLTGADGKKAYSVEFATQQDNPRAILLDMADVVRVAAGDVGKSVDRYEVTARYGSRMLRVVAPSAVAHSLSRGFTTKEKFLEASLVTMDGAPISPSYR